MAETIALIGGETLLGREVRDVFGGSSLGARLRLVAANEEETGTLTEIDGEPTFLAKFDPETPAKAAVVILAGNRQSSREALEAKPVGVVIDLTYVTEDDADSQLRAPLVESPEHHGDHTGPQMVAHPAATAIAILLGHLHRAWPIANSLIHIFEPASERDKAGIDELQQQTMKLFSFQPLPKKIFDAQISFNMLAQLGDEAQTQLLEIEERIERHLATLLDRGDGVPMPSLRLIQSPVFHGYSFSLWIEFEDAPTAAEIEESLAHELIDVRSGGTEAPNNVGIAGQSGVAVGAISPDRNNSRAVWMWMVADNLRIAAESAAMIAREVV